MTAYVDWWNDRLEKYNYDAPIYSADLLYLTNLNHALCRSIPEVTRKHGTGPFPSATLYQMIVAIQKYLVVNKLKWNLMDLDEFEDTRTVHDNAMQERTAANIMVVKRQAGIIPYEHENSLLNFRDRRMKCSKSLHAEKTFGVSYPLVSLMLCGNILRQKNGSKNVFNEE